MSDDLFADFRHADAAIDPGCFQQSLMLTPFFGRFGSVFDRFS